MNDLTVANILQVTAEDLRVWCFSLVDSHVDYVEMDREKFLYLLGYYPAIYTSLAELHSFMINKVREAKRAESTPVKRDLVDERMDKRDILEEVLKAIKFQYDSLSRKITIYSGERDAST
jgi:hypothetical protein